MKTISMEELLSYTTEEMEKFIEECENQPQPIGRLNHRLHPDSDYLIHWAWLYKHENNDLYYVVNMNSNEVTERQKTLDEIYSIYLPVPLFLDENE